MRIEVEKMFCGRHDYYMVMLFVATCNFIMLLI